MFSAPRRTAVLIAPFIALLALSGCEGGPTEPEDGLLTVSGTLTNRTGKPVPASTRVLVAWEVSSGSPDYLYVFGEGTVNAGAKTFRITFDDPPPPEALNSNGLGVGIVLLTTDPELKAGARLEAEDASSIVGAAGQHAVIYTAGEPATIGGWVAKFPQGYSVGKGAKSTGTFDIFQPASPGSVEIIVDALGNIEFVNWT